MKTLLGKIISAEVGMGGYQGEMFGVTFDLKLSDGSQVSDFLGHFIGVDRLMPVEWPAKLQALLSYSGKRLVRDLPGLPIEAVFDDNFCLESWRLLTEVL